jgi:hypothetical protein
MTDSDRGDLMDLLTGRFAHIDRQFARVNQQLAEMNERFAEVDQRFAQVDRHHFGEVNQQFAQVHRRFSQADERLDRIDARFVEVARQCDEVAGTFDEVARRFGEVDGRSASPPWIAGSTSSMFASARCSATWTRSIGGWSASSRSITSSRNNSGGSRPRSPTRAVGERLSSATWLRSRRTVVLQVRLAAIERRLGL